MRVYYFFLIFAFTIITACIIAVINNNNEWDKMHSPLDTYVDGVVQKHEDSIKHATEVKLFLDSINRREYETEIQRRRID